MTAFNGKGRSHGQKSRQDATHRQYLIRNGLACPWMPYVPLSKVKI